LKNRRWTISAAVVFALTTLAAGCGGGGEDNQTTSSTGVTATDSSTTNSSIFGPAPTTAPPAGSIDCGLVKYLEFDQRLVVLRGVDCEEAKTIFNAEVAGTSLPVGWDCFDGKLGDSANVVCGSGPGYNVYEKKAAFVLRDPQAPWS
jgi:hypothetical protein